MTKEREATLILLSANKEELARVANELTMEDVLYLVEHQRNATDNPDEVSDYIVDVLLDAVKRHEGWFVLRSGLAPVPFIKDGRGYIFTEEKLGLAVMEKLLKRGYHTELYLQPMYEEDTLQLLVRNGAKSISINKGCNGIVFDARSFPPPTDGQIVWGESEIQLNAAVSEFVTVSDIGDDEAVAECERKLAMAFNKCQLYFVSTPENPTLPKIEDSFADGYQHNCFYVFTDMNELRTRYPRRSLLVHRKPGYKIFEKMNGAEFVLNPISSNIIFGDTLTGLCSEEAINYKRILVEVKKCLGDSKLCVEMTDTIVKYRDIRDEFLAALRNDGYEYPLENPVAVQNYTAQVLQRIVAQNHVEAYSMLSKMRTFPESVRELLAGKQM